MDFEKSRFEVVEHTGSYYQSAKFWVCLEYVVYTTSEKYIGGLPYVVYGALAYG